jgi:hypothetical protein
LLSPSYVAYGILSAYYIIKFKALSYPKGLIWIDSLTARMLSHPHIDLNIDEYIWTSVRVFDTSGWFSLVYFIISFLKNRKQVLL